MRDFCMPNEASYREYQQHVNRYVFASSFAKGKIVLDVACGVGYGSSHLVRKGANVVVGGDISEDNLNYAKGHYEREGLHFVQMDATTLPFPDGYFDVIVSFETIEHLRDYRRFLSECNRILKKGGVFVCSTPNVKRFPFQSAEKPVYHFHVREFHVEQFQALIEEYFTDVTLFHQASTLRGFIIPLVGRLLSAVPKGEQLKGLTRKLIQCDMPYRTPGVEVLDREIDEKYAVLAFKKKLFSLPSCIIITVAKKY